ncbi:MAG: hypothetical protein WCO56_17005 [Verrucomicrobiota bacterium]
MNKSILSLTLMLLVSVATSAGAQFKKPPGLPGSELFFTMKGKMPFALDRWYPGIVAALLLTDDQKLDLQKARQEIADNSDLRATGQKLKQNPDASKEERAAYQKQYEEAREKLRQAVAEILTPQQKALVGRIQNAAEEAQQAAVQTLQPVMAQAKGDEAKTTQLRQTLQETIKTELAQRLEVILTTEQKSAVQAAAIAQAEREEKGALLKNK